MNTRAIATVFVCFAVVFAGCAGIFDSVKEQAKNAAEDAASDALNESEIGDMINDSARDALEKAGVANLVMGNATRIGFGFEQGETYTYEVLTHPSSPSTSDEKSIQGRFIVTVQEAAGQNVTVTMRYEQSGETFTETFSGTQKHIAIEFTSISLYGNLSPSMSTLRDGTKSAITSGMGFYRMKKAASAIGNPSLKSRDGTTLNITTDTDSYADVECEVTTLSTSGIAVAESCISTELGLPVYVVIKNKSGTVKTRLKLVKYES